MNVAKEHMEKYGNGHVEFRHFFTANQMKVEFIVGIACLVYSIIGLSFLGRRLVVEESNVLLEYGFFGAVAVIILIGVALYRFLPWKSDHSREIFASLITEFDILLYFIWGFVVIDISVSEGRTINYIPLLIVFAICTTLFYLFPAVYIFFYIFNGTIAILYFRVFNYIDMDMAIFVNILIFSGVLTVISLARYFTQKRSFESDCKIRDLSKELEEQLVILDYERQRADDANRAKGTFLTNMSHEIRTPINTVLGLDTMILRESKEANIKRFAKDIQSAGRSLLSLINDILDFSKIESGKMELVCANYELSGIINDVVNMIRPRAQEKELEFIVEVDEGTPDRLYGDEVRIKQVIVNLLTNAVKYTHKGSVKLSISSKTEGNVSRITVSVKDTGIGIKEEDISKLSEEFVRIEESRNRNIEGTGLGMNIVIQLLSLMGSKIEVESVYGEGSNFHFTLEQPVAGNKPIGKIDDILSSSADNEDYMASFIIPDARLLVVDDNAMNRNVFLELLKDLECKIDEAESGEQCLSLIKDTKYDIIFMDHMMPGMDGIETYKAMKEMQNHPNQETPVIILTANAISGAKEEYLSQGFNDYLSKPIDVDKLESMIGRFVSADKKQEAKRKVAQLGVDSGCELDLPFIDGVDWDGAMLKLRSEDLLKKSIESFMTMSGPDMSTLKKMYQDISTSSDENAFEAYRIKVHSMKSNAATIGAYHVAGLAKFLEYAARDMDRKTIDELMGTFEKQWQALRSAIEEAFGKKDTEREDLEPISEAVLTECLDILAEAMEEFDIDKADAVMEEFSEYSFPDGQRQLIENLNVAVMNMDADECLHTIEEIKRLI